MSEVGLMRGLVVLPQSTVEAHAQVAKRDQIKAFHHVDADRDGWLDHPSQTKTRFDRQEPKILDPDPQYRSELSANPAAFRELIDRALSVYQTHFFPGDAADKSKFAAFGDSFLREAIDLARELYPDHTQRDVAYNAIDTAWSRLYGAATPHQDPWSGFFAHSPTKAARLVDSIDTSKRYSTPPLDEGLVWNAPVHSGIGKTGYYQDLIGKPAPWDVSNAVFAGPKMITTIDPKTGGTVYRNHNSTVDFQNPHGPVLVDSMVTSAADRRVTELYVDTQKNERIERDVEFRRGNGGFERHVIDERTTAFDPKDAPRNLTSVAGLDFPDFSWTPATPGKNLLVITDLCTGLDNAAVAREFTKLLEQGTFKGARDEE